MYYKFFSEFAWWWFVIIETCSKTRCHLLNGVVFHKSVWTVILYILILAITLRNFKILWKSRHIPCHCSVMIWFWDVCLYTARKLQGLYKNSTHKLIFPVRNCVFKFEITTHRSSFEDAIISLRTHITLNTIQLSSDLPCCIPICWSALMLH